MEPSKLALISLVGLAALLGATGQVFFKLGAANLDGGVLSWVTNWKILFGLFLYGFTTILFLWALRFGNLSILYPVVATSYVWVAIFSVAFLGEAFPWFKWFGVGAILGGVLIIAL